MLPLKILNIPRRTNQYVVCVYYVIYCIIIVVSPPEFYKQFKRAEKQFAHFLATGQHSAANIAEEFYEGSLAEMAKYLTESTVEFDMFAISVAVVLLYAVSMTTEN